MKSAAARRYAATDGDIIRLKAEAVYTRDKTWKLVIHAPDFIMEELRKGLWWSGSSCGGGLPESISFTMEAHPLKK